jgi:hypothetical protein
MLIKIFLFVSLSIPALAAAETLVGATDRELKITVQELRGMKMRTRNNLYVKATFARGAKDFELFCGRTGKLTNYFSELNLNCSVNSESVSNDDDESFEFKISVKFNKNQSEQIYTGEMSYSGDGTVYGSYVEIITGQNWYENKPRDLRIDLHSVHSEESSALALSQNLEQALRPLIGSKVVVREGRFQADFPIEEFSFRISRDLKTFVSAKLDTSELKRIRISDPAPIEFSLLTTAGDLRSGFRSVTSLRKEVMTLLKVK